MDDRPFPASKEGLALGLVALFSLLTAIYPIANAFYHVEVNYNEGWNVYNAVAVAQHVPLYGIDYGWTTVNYPPLSFYLVAFLSRFTHDYLLTGRLLSLLSLAASCVLVGLIIRKLTQRLAPALFGASFCLALFCAAASTYVVADDPQILAQVFFLAGLLLYISYPPTLGCIGAIAFLFVLGGNVKHNLIDFPLVVCIDLFLISRRKGLQFLLLSGILVGISVAVDSGVGGPFFISNLLAKRPYSLFRALLNFSSVYVPLFLPVIVASIWAARQRTNRWARFIASFFFASIASGIVFGGGEGVSTNAYFDSFLAISIVMGLLLDPSFRTGAPIVRRLKLPEWSLPILLSSCLLVTFSVSDNALLWRRLTDLPGLQKRYDSEVSFLRGRPGPEICESMLRCYAAGKPYIYDPFNSNRLMQIKKLDSNEIVSKIAAHDFAAIQLSFPVESFMRMSEHIPRLARDPVGYSKIQLGPFGALDERFPRDVLDAINRYYVLSVMDPDCDIYVPRTNDKDAAFEMSGYLD